MAQGSGGATVTAVLFLCICSILIPEFVRATTYAVGGANGWNFNIGNWTSGKRFKAGDILEFKYDRGFHNVNIVSKGDFDKCVASANSTLYQTGDDKITLKKGTQYFICSVGGHCQAGMKIAVTAV